MCESYDRTDVVLWSVGKQQQAHVLHQKLYNNSTFYNLTFITNMKKKYRMNEIVRHVKHCSKPCL